jgi:hypothetical protein
VDGIQEYTCTCPESFTGAQCGVPVGPPSVAVPKDMTVKMGASIKVNVWVSDPNTPLGDVEITAYSTNPSLLASDDIMIRGTGGERTLVFQPVVGVVGVTTVQVQVYDGVHTDTKGFRVEVSAPPADATRGELLATIPDGAKMECAVWGHPHVTMFSNLKYNVRWLEFELELGLGLGVVHV